MNYRWSNDSLSPRQHWLYRDTHKIENLGLVYEVRPDAFTVYLTETAYTRVGVRRWVAEMPTLDEAKDLLMTLVGSRS
jgi:hypothetical protein